MLQVHDARDEQGAHGEARQAAPWRRADWARGAARVHPDDTLFHAVPDQARGEAVEAGLRELAPVVAVAGADGARGAARRHSLVRPVAGHGDKADADVARQPGQVLKGRQDRGVGAAGGGRHGGRK